MKQFIPSLADKAALTLFYDSIECLDFELSFKTCVYSDGEDTDLGWQF